MSSIDFLCLQQFFVSGMVILCLSQTIATTAIYSINQTTVRETKNVGCVGAITSPHPCMILPLGWFPSFVQWVSYNNFHFRF